MHMHQRISCVHCVFQAVLWSCAAYSQHRMYHFLASNKPAALDFEGQNILLSCLLSWDERKWMRQRSIPIYSTGNSAGINWIWKWSWWSNMLLSWQLRCRRNSKSYFPALCVSGGAAGYFTITLRSQMFSSEWFYSASQNPMETLLDITFSPSIPTAAQPVLCL